MAYDAERRVLLAHRSSVDAVTERVARFVKDTYRGLGSWRDADIDRFVARVVPVVISGQRTVSQLTNSYLSAVARLAGVDPLPPPSVDVTSLRGVAPAEVYRRPAVVTYTALSQGRTLDEAVALAIDRIDQITRMDMQLSNIRTAHAFTSGDPRIVGWQRVLAPGENCVLCAIASTQRYRREDLAPIHDRCRCDVMPIYGTRDPGRVINGERLDEIRGLLESEGFEYTGGGFKGDRSIRVSLHGEHGPTLTWRDQKFTGPGAI